MPYLDSIVAWNDDHAQKEVALSFQDATAAKKMWYRLSPISRELLCTIRGCDSTEDKEESNQEELLVVPTLESLSMISERFRDCVTSLSKRSKITQQLLADSVKRRR